MPDDLNSNEVAEQVLDADFSEGFDEKEAPAPKPDVNTPPEDGAAPPSKNATAAGDDVDGDGGKGDGGKGDDEKQPNVSKDANAKPDDAKPAEEKTAQQKLEERAAASDKTSSMPPEQPASTPPPAKSPVESQDVADKPDDSGASGVWMKKLLESPEIAGIKIGDGTTIKEFAEEYPEAVQAPVVIAKALIEMAVAGISQEMQKMQAMIGGFTFWDGVQQAHPDARKMVGTQKFQDWAGKQSPLVQKMLHSDNVEDAVSVLDAYKESLAREEKDAKTAEAAKRKAAKDALHGETLRGTGWTQGGGGDDSKWKDDFDAGFNAQP